MIRCWWFSLISVKLAVVVVAVAVGISSLSALVSILALVRLLVGDRWSVSVLVRFVGHDLSWEIIYYELLKLTPLTSSSHLFPAIGQQHVITTDSLVSVARLHVSEIVAGLIILNGVFEVVLGWLSRVFISAVGVSVATGVCVSTAGWSIGGLQGSGRWVAWHWRLLLVRVGWGTVLLAGSRGCVITWCSILLAWGRRAAWCSILRAGTLWLLVERWGSVVGWGTGLISCWTANWTSKSRWRDTVVGGRRQILRGGRGILIGRQVGVGHWWLCCGQQDAGECWENDE